jgi:hypothetical protein
MALSKVTPMPIGQLAVGMRNASIDPVKSTLVR